MNLSKNIIGSGFANYYDIRFYNESDITLSDNVKLSIFNILKSTDMKNADLISEEKQKNFIFYQLNTSVLEEIMLWISSLKGGEGDAENA